MNMQPNSKIVGSFLVGFALVAGAYTFSNFGNTAGTPSTINLPAETQQAAPIRSAIVVMDENGNGIEDWRDEFVTTEPIVVDAGASGPYQPPTTITGQMGINFVQNVINSRAYGEFGRSEQQIVADTLSGVEIQTSQAIYDTPDITVLENWDEAAIRSYANTVARVLSETGDGTLDHELLILQDILNRNDLSRLEELETKAAEYLVMRDTIVNTPVPALLAKQHLDLINTLHAINSDIVGMTLSYEDPVYSLMRIKRYEDDVLGLLFALENMYTSLEPYASIFTTEDPAVFFVQFSPTNRIRI